MKKIIYIILALSLVTFSCKNRKEQKRQKVQVTDKAETPVATENPAMTEEAPTSVTMLEEDDFGSLVLISLTKTVCFGECPAYSVQFYKDGTVLYEGIENVERIGKFKGKLELPQINKLLESASEMGYFKLDPKYDNEYVSDMPTATTYINYKGKMKKVVCRFECDKNLIKINNEIENLTNSMSMKKLEK
tara:strand:- start:1135 stop:1704 length:570 start_codon:yes stop_codon:yes gene_type:complete